ncbi:MAG: hypothetical protein J0H98_05655 [Solirubrobacterales bacterium]|nr:hypothetical protein [Solirubrobacterales bacterium]
MGEGKKLILGLVALCVALTAAAGTAAASPQPIDNPWLSPQYGVLNMAHQGGEMEAPSSTMYAFRTALQDRGADSLEMDVNATSDGHLMVMHDYYTTKITPLDAQVRNLTMAQVQALDAAYWFSPGEGQFDHTLPAAEYPLRGVRTGERPPPDGFSADDFRVPTIDEVLAAFPDVPLNIEIKSVPGEPAESLRVASLLAEVMNRPENQGRRVIIASLDQDAIDKFHELAPQVDVSASLTAMIAFLGAGTPISPTPVAMQVPMLIGEMDVPKMLQDLDVASQGYAVHAWTDSFSSENDDAYAHLVESGVQGIMSSAPSRLADYFCRADVRRPDNSPRCERQVLHYELGYPSTSLRTFLRRGLPVTVDCDRGCYLSLAVRMRPGQARRLGIKGRPRPIDRGLVLIGTQRRVTGPVKAGRSTFRTGIFRQPYRRLARFRRAAVEISVNVFDGSGWKTAVERRWLKLASPRPLRRR